MLIRNRKNSTQRWPQINGNPNDADHEIRDLRAEAESARESSASRGKRGLFNHLGSTSKTEPSSRGHGHGQGALPLLASSGLSQPNIASLLSLAGLGSPSSRPAPEPRSRSTPSWKAGLQMNSGPAPWIDKSLLSPSCSGSQSGK